VASGYGLPGKPFQWSINLPYAEAHDLRQVCYVDLPGGFRQWVLNHDATGGEEGAGMGLCYEMAGRYYSEP
jgi:hypothetical protein